MELDRPSLRHRLRSGAHSTGLTRFWRWWTTELASLMPSASRGALQRRRLRPAVELGADTATVWLPSVAEGRGAFVAFEQVPLTGEPDAVAATGAAAMSRLRERVNARARPLKLVVALPSRQVLRKDLVLPSAVEDNLRQALAYDLDRHTPFRPEQLYFDAAVVGRDPAKGTIRVEWAAALKTVVDAARRQVEGWGVTVEAVVPAPLRPAVTRINLIPFEERPRILLWKRWDVWAPIAITALLLLGAVIVPLAQKREYTIALTAQAEQARIQAEAADALRQQLTRMQDDYNLVLARKYGYPSTVQVLDEVTRLMPDDTWITQFELKTNGKGKELQRDMLIRGETGNASRLIGPLEDSKLVEQAAPRSPTTKIQPGPGEIFDLGAQLKALPPPQPVTLADAAGAPASPAAPGTPASTIVPAAPAGPGTPAAPSGPGATAAPGAPQSAAAPNAPAAAPAPSSGQPAAAANPARPIAATPVTPAPSGAAMTTPAAAPKAQPGAPTGQAPAPAAARPGSQPGTAPAASAGSAVPAPAAAGRANTSGSTDQADQH